MAKKNTKNDEDLESISNTKNNNSNTKNNNSNTKNNNSNTKNKNTKSSSSTKNNKNNRQTKIKHGLMIKRPVQAVVSKPKLFFYNILLDIGFLAIFLLINYLINMLLPIEPEFAKNMNQDTLLFTLLILGTVLYFAVMILIYSFFSLIVLGNIKSMSCDHKHDFSMLRKMFFLNIIMFAIFFIISLLFNILMYLIIDKPLWLIAAGSLIIIIISFIIYAFYNFSSAAFILGHTFKDNIKKSLKSIFTRSCAEIIIFNIAIIAAYIIIYFTIGTIFKNNIMDNYGSFMNISSIITIIIVYLLFAFNRIYFFFAAEKHMK